MIAAPDNDANVYIGAPSTTISVSQPFTSVNNARFRGLDVVCFSAPRSYLSPALEKSVDRVPKISNVVHHENVLQCLHAGINATSIFVVMERTDLGTLDNFLASDMPLNVVSSLHIMRAVAKGMCALHAAGVVHRVLSASSVYLSTLVEAKVGNLEFCRFLFKNTAMTNVGLPTYAAPEILMGSTKYTTAVDVYSFGILTSHVMTRRAPYADIDAPDAAIHEAIVKQHFRPNVPAAGAWPVDLFALMRECWGHNPEQRPSFEAIAMRLDAMLQALQ